MTVVHALSVDVEDWFQVLNMVDMIDRADWDRYELRCVDSTRRLLDLFATRDAKATFFCLGWIAERMPNVIEEIHGAGHELGSHGYDHRVLAALAPHVACQRPVHRFADPRTVERGQHGACIGVSEEGLAPRSLRQPGDGRRGNTHRAVAAHGEPHRVELRIVRAFEQRGQPLQVGAREMAVGLEALRVDVDAVFGELVRHKTLDRLGMVGRDRGCGRADGDACHCAVVSAKRTPVIPAKAGSPLP